MAYKTPDVYVEEISVFPPSVAEVATAVPAFIGYTEKAMENTEDDLKFKAKRIKSLLDYESLYGKGAEVEVVSVEIDENNSVVSRQITANYYLYDALRLYFANGGGSCYIISIGKYGDDAEKSHFEKGLEELKMQDEPTILVFPDAVKLPDNDFYNIQTQALSQCNKLMDRVAVFDLKEGSTRGEWTDGVDKFRQNIGMNHLKYGAAYTPWLKTALGLNLRYSQLRGKIKRGGVDIKLTRYVKDDEVKNVITDLDNAVDNKAKIKNDIKGLRSDSATLRARYEALLDLYRSNPDETDAFEELFTLIYQMAKTVDDWVHDGEPLKVRDGVAASLRADAQNEINNSIAPAIGELAAIDKGAGGALSAGSFPLHPGHSFEDDALSTAVTDAAANTDVFGSETTDEGKMMAAEPEVTKLFHRVNATIQDLVNAAENYERDKENELTEALPVYKGIVRTLNNSLTALPPSGAVAGIYAMTDASRGVWKAPANVSISQVISPTVRIDNDDQDNLNVDTIAGKSINAIRAFTGKGTLVWGARTLAGNDNEWRYVSVRRFFNMVEESVKKSTYWAVFEPNDAKTWIKVKSMIENYLLQKWREGALQGSKPEQAFFVKIGLGVTMTAQDILEGRMNVEIGMAVVRPAEFIILKFSHKRPES